MPITVGQIKTGVLHQMREYSNAGTAQSESDIKDYLLSIVPLVNLYALELATTTHKLERKYEISHIMPENQLGYVQWNEEKVHTDSDVSYTAKGSKSYSFQVSRYATVYIEEETAVDTWNTLVTVTHTPTAGEGYVTYKGLTGVSSVDNNVRIRFSGLYRYAYRWIALFSDNFYDSSDVPAYEPYVPYTLPTNFYQIDRVSFSHADRQLSNYSAYKMDYTTSERKILLNWYDKGEFQTYYFAYPSVVATPDPNNLSASDSAVIDIADECAPALIHRICAALQRDENPYMSDIFENSAQISKAELVQNDSYQSGEQSIVLNSNW